MHKKGMSQVGKSGSGRASSDLGTPSISNTSSFKLSPPVKRENDLLKGKRKYWNEKCRWNHEKLRASEDYFLNKNNLNYLKQLKTT